MSEHNHDGDPTRGRYRAGCRHDDCRALAVAYVAQYRRKRYLADSRGTPLRVPVLGTQRRLLSLGTAGFSHATIAREAEVGRRQIDTLLWYAPEVLIHATTAQRVAAAFDRLAASPYPIHQPRKGRGQNLPKVVAAAKARGGVLPMLWDDEVLEDPNGQPVQDVTTKGSIDSERLVAAVGRGVTDIVMAEEFGVSPDALYRHLSRHDQWEAYDRLSARSGRTARPKQRLSA